MASNYIPNSGGLTPEQREQFTPEEREQYEELKLEKKRVAALGYTLGGIPISAEHEKWVRQKELLRARGGERSNFQEPFSMQNPGDIQYKSAEIFDPANNRMNAVRVIEDTACRVNFISPEKVRLCSLIPYPTSPIEFATLMGMFTSNQWTEVTWSGKNYQHNSSWFYIAPENADIELLVGTEFMAEYPDAFANRPRIEPALLNVPAKMKKGEQLQMQENEAVALMQAAELESRKKEAKQRHRKYKQKESGSGSLVRDRTLNEEMIKSDIRFGMKVSEDAVVTTQTKRDLRKKVIHDQSETEPARPLKSTPIPPQSSYSGLSQQNPSKQPDVQLRDFSELPQKREGADRSGLTFDPKHEELGGGTSEPENEPRLEAGESSIEYEPSEASMDTGSIFSLPDSISSKSSAHDELGVTGELVMFLIENTQLHSLSPSLCQNFEFATFKAEFHHLLQVFSEDLSKEATIPIERESVRFVSQQRRRISHIIGQEVFGLNDQPLLESLSQRQQLDKKERIEQYLESVVLSKGGKGELFGRQDQEQALDNDSSDDEVELVPFSNLKHIKNFLIKSKAFEKLGISITKLAARGDNWPVEKQPRHSVMDLQSKAEEDDKPLETSDFRASSGLSVPEELQVQKIFQVQSPSLPDMLHRLHFGVLRLLRPRLDVGHRRLEWKCNCGMPLYGDFRGDNEEIDKLVMDIQAHGFLVTQSGHGAKRLPASSKQTTTSNSASLAPLRPNASQASRKSHTNTTGTASQAVGGMPDPTVSGINTAASLSISASTGIKFVALCVNSGPFKKTYNEVDISSIPKDTQMFHGFKGAYEACRSSRTNAIRRWLTKPVDINFIQFAVEGLKRVYPITGPPDCTICAHMENKDDLVVKRRYEPHTFSLALAHPPIPSDLFFHLWECPSDITPAFQTMWLNRLPKKLHERLENVRLGTRPDGEIILGWGVLVIEGIHKQRISRLTTAMAALAIVVSVAYSAGKKDVSSGFAIGALVIACWTVLITALYFECQGSL